MGFFAAILDLVFPEYCVACEAKVSNRAPFCKSCAAKIRINELATYDLLGVDRVNTYFKYQDQLRQLLKETKYRRREDFLLYLLDRFDSYIDLDDDINMIVPVPLSVARFEDRGFNQAQTIAEWLSAKFSRPMDSRSLVRLKDTPAMYELSRPQRIDELHGAFAITAPDIFSGWSVLLVDDILTTGATMMSCAAILREAGAQNVRGFALARS